MFNKRYILIVAFSFLSMGCIAAHAGGEAGPADVKSTFRSGVKCGALFLVLLMSGTAAVNSHQTRNKLAKAEKDLALAKEVERADAQTSLTNLNQLQQELRRYEFLSKDWRAKAIQKSPLLWSNEDWANLSAWRESLNKLKTSLETESLLAGGSEMNRLTYHLEAVRIRDILERNSSEDSLLEACAVAAEKAKPDRQTLKSSIQDIQKANEELQRKIESLLAPDEAPATSPN